MRELFRKSSEADSPYERGCDLPFFRIEEILGEQRAKIGCREENRGNEQSNCDFKVRNNKTCDHCHKPGEYARNEDWN